MNTNNLYLANEILNTWLKCFEINCWNEYVHLLYENHMFEVAPQSGALLDVSSNTEELFYYLYDNGVNKITTLPVKTSINQGVIVFKFKEPITEDNQVKGHVLFWLSLDYEYRRVTTYFETIKNEQTLAYSIAC